jgi:hypothetical protein
VKTDILKAGFSLALKNDKILRKMRFFQYFGMFGLLNSFLTEAITRGNESGSTALEKPWWSLDRRQAILNRNLSPSLCQKVPSHCKEMEQ